jgi:hypothetical protein
MRLANLRLRRGIWLAADGRVLAIDRSMTPSYTLTGGRPRRPRSTPCSVGE